MKRIFDCREYTRRTWPPYQVDNAGHGRPCDTIIFFFLRTPTGRVSKYWASIRLHYSLRDKHDRLRRYIREMRPSPKKGYRWSCPYLSSGDPKDWETFSDYNG